MKTLPSITDPVFKKKEKYSSFDKFILNYIIDERDLPFIYLSLKITFINIPFCVLLFTSLFTGWVWWLVAVLYAVAVIYFVGPYTLMLHNTSHRRLFKPEYKIFNFYIPIILGPFMGQSPETYFSHHIGMHHVENNLPDDKSSTMKYQRDSFIDFLKYSVGFLFFGIYELAVYFKQKKFKKLFNMVVRGEFSFILLIFIFSFVHLKAAIFVFAITAVIVRFAMMSGNWGQHAFIDASSPENNYRNSITCINSAYNRKCFNDGYHIGHHLQPNMHWTDMPVEFEANHMEYANQRAIVYDGLDFHMVWVFLMLKRYDILAKHFVNIGNKYESKEQVIQLLKERTRLIEI